MPIYAYRCGACGHAKDVLRKLSDPALTTCPACGAEAFNKQVTAAGFQLKGSGWYATDFKNPVAPPAGEKADGDKPAEPAPAKTADAAAPAAAPVAAPAASTPAVASPPPAASSPPADR